MIFSPDGHLEEALSAYLDDELSPAARGDADAHLRICADCRDELETIGAVRAAVRGLPIHLRPPRFGDDLASYRSPAGRRPGLWAAAAVAAAVLAFLLPRDPGVAPALPSLAHSHAARASVTGDPLTQLAPIAVPVRFGP